MEFGLFTSTGLNPLVLRAPEFGLFTSTGLNPLVLRAPEFGLFTSTGLNPLVPRLRSSRDSPENILYKILDFHGGGY
jgi:hypothetical protein